MSKANKVLIRIPALLTVACLLLVAIGGLICIVSGRTIVAILLMVAGALCCIIGLCLTMQKVLATDGVPSVLTVLVCAVLCCIVTAFALLAGKFGSLSYGIMHTLADGMTAALLTAVLLSLLGDKSKPVFIVPAGVVTALCGALGINIAVIILLCLLAAAVAAASVFHFTSKTPMALSGILLAVFVICLSITGTDLLHALMHGGVLVACAVIIWGAKIGYGAALAAHTAERRNVGQAKDVQPAESDDSDSAPEQPAGYSREPAPVRELRKKPARQEEAARPGAKWVDKAYRDLSYAEILDSPVDALYGVSDSDAELLRQAFNIKTVRDLAENKFFNWAVEIVEEADSADNAQ